MGRIVLGVKPSISDKWKRASVRLKKQVTEAVEQVLAESNEHKPTAEDIRSFYTAFQVDMSGYTFNRDEANER